MSMTMTVREHKIEDYFMRDLTPADREREDEQEGKFLAALRQNATIRDGGEVEILNAANDYQSEAEIRGVHAGYDIACAVFREVLFDLLKGGAQA